MSTASWEVMPAGLSIKRKPSRAASGIAREACPVAASGHEGLHDRPNRVFQTLFRRVSGRQSMPTSSEHLADRAHVRSPARAQTDLEPPVALLLQHAGHVGLSG